MESVKQISWGAESNLYLVSYLGRKAILKKRIMKPYMHYLLASRLVYRRTLVEAKILYEANKIGVPSPLPLKIDPENGILIMTYIRGSLVKNIVSRRGADKFVLDLMCRLGGYVALLHNHGIIHGDLTTSNLIYSSNKDKLYLVDYGLAFKSSRPEDKAMDLRVLERSLESTHPGEAHQLFNIFLQAYYSRVSGVNEIKERLDDIRRRGRYISERRRK